MRIDLSLGHRPCATIFHLLTRSPRSPIDPMPVQDRVVPEPTLPGVLLSCISVPSGAALSRSPSRSPSYPGARTPVACVTAGVYIIILLNLDLSNICSPPPVLTPLFHNFQDSHGPHTIELFFYHALDLIIFMILLNIQ